MGTHRLETLLEHLKMNGYRMTGPRQVVLEALIASQDKFLSVDALCDLVKTQDSKVNVTTVYRNLEALESLGLVHKTLFEDHVAYFKLTCHHHHHHHMICTSCGKITIIDYCPMESLKKMAQQEQFIIEGHRLEIFGKCKQCANKK